jgi:hypothetical protein
MAQEKEGKRTRYPHILTPGHFCRNVAMYCLPGNHSHCQWQSTRWLQLSRRQDFHRFCQWHLPVDGFRIYLNAGQQVSFWISDWTPDLATDYGRPGNAMYFDNAGAMTVDVVAVPEPSSIVSILCGAGGIA